MSVETTPAPSATLRKSPVTAELKLICSLDPGSGFELGLCLGIWAVQPHWQSPEIQQQWLFSPLLSLSTKKILWLLRKYTT